MQQGDPPRRGRRIAGSALGMRVRADGAAGAQHGNAGRRAPARAVVAGARWANIRAQPAADHGAHRTGVAVSRGARCRRPIADAVFQPPASSCCAHSRREHNRCCAGRPVRRARLRRHRGRRRLPLGPATTAPIRDPCCASEQAGPGRRRHGTAARRPPCSGTNRRRQHGLPLLLDSRWSCTPRFQLGDFHLRAPSGVRAAFLQHLDECHRTPAPGHRGRRLSACASRRRSSS